MGSFLDGGWSCQGHGPHAQPLFLAVLACNGLRGNDRHPKGRDAERLGCAAGAGERDPTSRRGRPNPPRSYLQRTGRRVYSVPEDERLTNEPACVLQRFRQLSEVLETGSACCKDRLGLLQMEREQEFAIIRHAYAKRILAQVQVYNSRLEQAFAEVHREDFLGPGPWVIPRWLGEYVRPPPAQTLFICTSTASCRSLRSDISITVSRQVMRDGSKVPQSNLANM